jgi:effector-binding domain-containing protein
MKFIKGLLTVIVVLVALVMLISLFLPSEYEVSRKTVIKASSEKVYTDVLDLNNWGAWDPWQKMDTNMVNTIVGEPGVGQKNTWKSEVIGNGAQTITMATAYSEIESLFEHEEMSSGTGFFKFNQIIEGTEITWGFKGENPFYMRIMGLMMDMFLGAQLESGLANLKLRMEALPDVPAIKMEDMEAIYFLSSKANVAVTDISNTLGNLYGGIMAYMGAKNIEMSGMPMCFYHTWDSDKTEMEAAIPVEEGKYKHTETISYGKLESGKVVTVTFLGSYDEMVMIHESIASYIEENGLEMRGTPLEIYVNDPTLVEPDRVETKIIYPVKG